MKKWIQNTRQMKSYGARTLYKNYEITIQKSDMLCTCFKRRHRQSPSQPLGQNDRSRPVPGLKQPNGDGERWVTAAPAAAKETTTRLCQRRAPKVSMYFRFSGHFHLVH